MFAFSSKANYGDYRKEVTPSFSGLFSDSWETSTGKFGFLLAASTSEHKSRGDGIGLGNFHSRGSSFIPITDQWGDLVDVSPKSPVDGPALPGQPAGSVWHVQLLAGASIECDFATVHRRCEIDSDCCREIGALPRARSARLTASEKVPKDVVGVLLEPRASTAAKQVSEDVVEPASSAGAAGGESCATSHCANLVILLPSGGV
jgi:hypothetical protein